MYTRDTRVEVFPFTQQQEGEQIIIGRRETNTFLALAPDAVKVLDLLAEGRTLGEVQEFYHERYGERPDLEEFLEELKARGFVASGEGAVSARKEVGQRAGQGVPENGFHFKWLPERLARTFFGRGTMAVGGLLIIAALAVLCFNPDLLPGRNVLLFHEHRALKVLTLLCLSYGAVFLHEMGHLVAARAAGVPSRLGIGHRLWMLVAETDLTGLWAVPKNKRYLPFLAGMFVDSIVTSLLLLVVFGYKKDWISLSEVSIELASAMLLIILLRLLWQCFFFIRTDLYYVLANLLGCRNLLTDTEDYLRNGWARLFSRRPRVDQSHIPAQERRYLRLYAPVYILGRLVALSVFVLVVLPVTWSYAQAIGHVLRTGYAADPYDFMDTIALAVVPLVTTSIGMGLWITGLAKRWRRKN